MGQVLVLERLTLHVDEGQRTQASIKGKVSNLKRGLGEKWQKTRASQPTSRRKTPGVKTTLPCMNTTKNPPPGDQGLAFQTHALQMILFGPFYVRTQHCYGSLRIVSSQYIYIYIYILLFKELHLFEPDFFCSKIPTHSYV